MIRGFREFQSIRIERGPDGKPVHHIHVERRDLTEEEAEKLRQKALGHLRNPSALFGTGLFEDFRKMLPPEAQTFLDEIRAKMGRRP